ncbi:hypothetical protein MTE01_16600 [Microbacterium testaceum]|uniref:Camelysin metallo-endopeptidase n=1 Tax=Microbacterium testaceum TaxID=2033 RepID=A0A4Y3QKK3_MICTE|nr:hypothetical protein [Microbacterium testaceum]GEB45715.1 hypothetical protein MTE01_16600 [Microbacterium testaceum]
MSTTKAAFSKKKVLVASIALLTMGLGGTVATGAYFTADKTVASNTLAAGTVAIGNIGDDASSTAPLTFSNVLPVADSDVAAKAKTFNINVRNNGTAAIDWKAAVSSTSSDFAKQVNVQYSTDGGTTWSNKTTADALSSVSIPSSSSLAASGTAVIKFRAWLPASTDNSAQNKTLTFTLSVNAIQAGAQFPA